MKPCKTHDDLPYPAGHPFDGMEFMIDSGNCLKCQIVVPWNALGGLCDECREAEDFEDAERTRGPQTLADVGMCEADFR
jgi:hypothetical protein